MCMIFLEYIIEFGAFQEKLVVLVIICILLGKPWKKKFLIKNHLWEFFAIIIAIGYAIIMLSRIYFPDIASYTGKFCYYNNAF